MRSGPGPLVAAVSVAWLVVWSATQLGLDPPLSIGPTVLAGVAASLVAVVVVDVLLRTPRRRGRTQATDLDGDPGDVLAAVGQTLPHLRGGLTTQTAARTAALLLPLTGGRAVEITDTEYVLGDSTGASEPPFPPLCDAAAAAVQRNQTVTVRLDGGAVRVATPLRVEDEAVGALCVVHGPEDVPSLDRIESLAGLVAMHLEIAELTSKARLAADAKLDALRAQINPHFLFNTLNTIAAKLRTDPDEARQLIQRLSEFFRYATRQEGQFAEFANEYFFVRTYLALEQARYDDRLTVHFDVDPQVLTAQVPVLTIQPLVENAVKHGLAAKDGGGTVTLRARMQPLAGSTEITVRDDGVGIDPDTLAAVLRGTYRSDTGGVGLANISQRLESLFGNRYRMDIRSTSGRGTSVELELPLR